jgi:hypothetical protein
MISKMKYPRARPARLDSQAVRTPLMGNAVQIISTGTPAAG